MQLENWISKAELTYLNSEECARDYPLLAEKLHKPSYSLNDIGVSSRDVNYWAQKKIMPELTSAQGKRLYTLKQAIWIRMIVQLRSMDIGLVTIKQIKETIYDQGASLINIGQLLKDENTISILKEQFGVDGYENLVKKVSASIKSEPINSFELLIQHCMLFRHPTSFIITTDGIAIPYALDKHDVIMQQVPEMREVLLRPHIQLSVNVVLQDLMDDWIDKKWFASIPFITEDEKAVIGLIREPNFKEVTIYKKLDTIDRVETREEIKIEDLKSFSNYILNNGYQTLTVKTRNGKPVHFENKVSLKI